MTNAQINCNNIHHVTEVMTDEGSFYTRSNQSTGSEMHYSYIHDYACSEWAGNGCHGLCLDERTAGQAVAHNVHGQLSHR